MVLQAKGTKPLRGYIERRKAMVAEWVFLRPVFEVCVKEMGFKGGEGARSVVASDSRGEAAEYHAKIDFTAAIDQQRREFDRCGEG